MTKVGCILVVDVASLSLLAQCCCCLWRCKSITEPSPRRQLLGRLLSAFPNTQIEQLHHCMLFSLQHLQFVMQWSSSLHTEHSHTSRADQDKHTQISRHQKTSPPKIHDTLISPVKWNHVHQMIVIMHTISKCQRRNLKLHAHTHTMSNHSDPHRWSMIGESHHLE